MTDVYVAELDPASGRVLVPPVLATQRFAGSNSKPDWSSDGRQLVFLSKRGPGAWGARAICVRDTESGEVRELASRLNRVAWVRWSPDGRYLLAAASVDGGFPICRIDVQTGAFERVVPNALGWPAVWSPDGRAIFFNKYNKTAKALSVVARDLGASQEKELFSVADPSYYCAGLALSGDGRQLAFAVHEAESQSRVLKVLPAAGGEARDVLRGVEMPLPGSVAWTPDGLSLLFTTTPGPRSSRTELWLVPVQGGEPRKLDLVADNTRDLRVHPDGRHIAYTAGKDRSEVWALSNFLPAAEAAASR
jgi:Tol biopolymer transport system component